MSPPEGATQVPSPLQKVEDVAPVPELRFVTGKFPVTPLLRSTCAQAGLLLVPVFDKYLVADALLAKLAIELAESAYSISP